MHQFKAKNKLSNLQLLSIIIPALEPDAELSRCIACILSVMQNEILPEIIIVTPSRFTDVTSLLYPYAKIINESRRGIYSAMNDGARASRGDYIYFMGKDDMILSSLLEALLILKEKSPFALFCDVYWGDAGVYSGKPSALKILTKNLCHQGIIYSRQAFAIHGPYVRQMRVQADHFLNIKMLWDKKFSKEISYLKKPLALYASNGFSANHRDKIFWRLYPNILCKYVGLWAKYFLILYRMFRSTK